MVSGPRHYSMHDARLWEEFAQDRLTLQRCGECETFRYPPAPCCPDCLSTEFTWKEVSGKASVISWATFHRQYLPAYPAPCSVIVVKLDEGPMMVTSIPEEDVAKLSLNAPVEVTFEVHPDGYRLPVFRPLGARQGA